MCICQLKETVQVIFCISPPIPGNQKVYVSVRVLSHQAILS